MVNKEQKIYDEGFQRGKLEQKKEELKFLKERCIYCMIADERIKQLQKEIHSQQNPTQSNGSMNNGLGTSSADTKEIGEEKQNE